MIKNYKNLLVSGCSFSQSGIGGCPPTLESDGGCSFIDRATELFNWPGYLSRMLQIQSLVNTASASHGNILVANTINYCLKKYNYSPKDTLIVLNLSEPTRLDLLCDHIHPSADKSFIPWQEDLIPYSFFSTNSAIIQNTKKDIGLEQVDFLTSCCIDLLFGWLENIGYDFYFLTMSNFSNSQLSSVLEKYQQHFISLEPGINMADYAKITGELDVDQQHPNQTAHQKIAEQIYAHINL